MIQKELKLLTKDELRLGHCYTEKTPNSAYETLVGAFGHTKTPNYSTYKFTEPRVITDAYVYPKLMKTIKTMGASIELNVLSEVTGINSMKTIAEITDLYPKIGVVMNKQYVKGWLEKANRIIVDKRQKYVDSVDLLYSEMIQVHTELDYKSDLATLAELDDLLYCEAEGFLLKMEEKINKKNNPKNLKLYKALQALRTKPIITCEHD